MRDNLKAIEAAAAAQAAATSPLPPAPVARVEPLEAPAPDELDLPEASAPDEPDLPSPPPATKPVILPSRVPQQPALTATFAARVDPELAQRVTYTCTVLGITKQDAAASMIHLWLEAVAHEYGIETTPPALRPPTGRPRR